MDNRRSNKNSATEDELGLIHNLSTKLHIMRLQEMVRLIQDGGNVELVIGDGKALQAAGKWAADSNLITCAQPEMDEKSELSKRLAEIKAKQFGRGAMASGDSVVIPFDDGMG